MSVATQMDLPVSESATLLNDDDSAEVNPPHPHQTIVAHQIGRSRWRCLATEVGTRSLQQLTNINVYLIFVPLGVAAAIFKANAVLVSSFNFLAIIPLSAIVSNSSDKLSDYWGPVIGGLINATFGNAVELIVGILAITHNEITVAQSTMLGSILSDILAVLGGCLISAAHGSGILDFNSAVADSLSSLMFITAVALILPTVLRSTLTNTAKLEDKIRSFSQATAVVLLGIYAIYLYFQLHTHKEIFLDEKEDVNTSSGESEDTREGNDIGGQEFEQDGQPEMPSQGLYTAAVVLVVSAATIMICTHYFIDSLDATAKFTNFSKTFIATILIPIASNAPECSTVIMASRKKRINYAIGVIVGSILQIAFFVLPILVVIGWALDKPMTLYFKISHTCILFLAVLMVNQVLQDGKYTYLHGIMLLSLYVIVAAAIFIQPAE